MKPRVRKTWLHVELDEATLTHGFVTTLSRDAVRDNTVVRS